MGVSWPVGSSRNDSCAKRGAGRKEGRRNEQEIRYFLRKGVVKRKTNIQYFSGESSNGSFFHTIDMLFNGNGMIWEGDSTLNVKIFLIRTVR